jgi:membrane protein DedA with SNARE-associated domain
MDFITQLLTQLGYFGAGIAGFLMFIPFPFPLQPLIITDGHLAKSGELNLFMLLFMTSLSTFLGTIFNYYFAKKIGREVLVKRFSAIEKLEIFLKAMGNMHSSLP